MLTQAGTIGYTHLSWPGPKLLHTIDYRWAEESEPA